MAHRKPSHTRSSSQRISSIGAAVVTQPYTKPKCVASNTRPGRYSNSATPRRRIHFCGSGNTQQKCRNRVGARNPATKFPRYTTLSKLLSLPEQWNVNSTKLAKQRMKKCCAQG